MVGLSRAMFTTRGWFISRACSPPGGSLGSPCVGNCGSSAGSTKRALLLALPLGCATQQREPTLERASGTGGTAADLHSTNKLPLATSEPTLEAAVRIMNVSPGRFLVEARAPVDVATTATLERRSDGGEWVPVRYELRESCAPPAGGVPACRPLAPGARFAPLSWNGTSCGPCCNEEEPAPIEPGAYRLRLSACNDGRRPLGGTQL